jgi:hypothetical protein
MVDPSGISTFIPLIQAIGVWPTIFSIGGIVLIFIVYQVINSIIRRRGTFDVLERSRKQTLLELKPILDKFTEKVDIVVEGQSFLMSSTKDIAEAIIQINNSLKNNITRENLSFILRRFFEGYLFSESMEKIRYYIELCKDKKEEEIEDLKKQLLLELTNLFDDFLTSLNDLNTSIDIVKIISENFYEQIVANFIIDMIETGCNKLWGTAFKYDKIKASFHFLGTQVIQKIACEYDKKRNGGA